MGQQCCRTAGPEDQQSISCPANAPAPGMNWDFGERDSDMSSASRVRDKSSSSSSTRRTLSLPKSVAEMGFEAWNNQPHLANMKHFMNGVRKAKTVTAAMNEISSLMKMGYNIWAYAYLQALANHDQDLYYGLLTMNAVKLLPVAYTPTVGEACQKFGHMPFLLRGCYVSLVDRGNIRAVLLDYAQEQLLKGDDGMYQCQCIVFSDGGRILGLGDLGAWGMGIPLGKLDLYTVCGGFDPRKTIPVIIDAGISGPEGNTAGINVRGDELYTGLRKDRVKRKSAAGTDLNSAYYGQNSLIREFFDAARELFGPSCLLQFEDFNSSDAMPLLAEYRNEFLTYNDDIQGTASVAIAALLGAIRIQRPESTDLVGELRKMTVLFHGAGSANVGGANLIIEEGGLDRSRVICTNSKGVIWRSEDGKSGSFRNDEQKALAQVGQPSYLQDLVSIVQNVKPDAIVGAVGRAPNCFTKEVIQALLDLQDAKPKVQQLRPIVFALSNPRTQAEITAHDAYNFSNGRVIFGSGTRFEEVTVAGKTREPGQVNNFFIFPGMSFGAMCCKAKYIPERFFMVAAEAVANCLDDHDIATESVVPHPERCKEVALAVSTAVVLEAQKMKLAQEVLGGDSQEVQAALKARMWVPKSCQGGPPKFGRRASRTEMDFGNERTGHRRLADCFNSL